jgi:segregation and condensation protein B
MVKVALVCYVPTEEWSFIYHKDISEDELKNLRAQETVNSADYDEEWLRAGETLFSEGWEPEVWVHKIDTNYEDDSLIISSGEEIEEDDGEEKEGTDDSEDVNDSDEDDEDEDEDEDEDDSEDDEGEEGDSEDEGEDEDEETDEESELSVSGKNSENSGNSEDSENE